MIHGRESTSEPPTSTPHIDIDEFCYQRLDFQGANHGALSWVPLGVQPDAPVQGGVGADCCSAEGVTL